MVWFAAEDNDFRSSKDPFETLDPPPPDLSFADSFLDFDSIQQWFEAKSSTDMAVQPHIHHASDPSIQILETNALPQQVLPEPHPKAQVSECENLVDLGSAIEEGMGKINLSVGIQSEVVAEDEGGSSSTSSSSSSSTSSGSSYSSDSSDDDADEEQRRDKKGEGKTEDIDEELEEGEIRDSDGPELVTETAAVDSDDESDVEKKVSWIGMSDDEEEDGNASGRPSWSTNELEALPPVPPVDLTLEPHHQMQPVGVVMSIMGAKVIVEGQDKHCPLDEGSILWMTEIRKPLGLVDEVFGPVKNPYYVVRYNSENEVPAGVCGGASISFVPEFANHVLNNKDVCKKGYDASGSNDESSDSEFSDDEKEDEYRRKHSVTKRGINDKNPANGKNNRRKNDQNPAYRTNYRKKGPVKTGAIPAIPGIGQGPNNADTIAPPCPPPPSVNPYSAANGIQTNGCLPSQPQPALFPNGFPTNGASWFSQNPPSTFQFPVPEIPFQHQFNFNPTQVSLSANMFPGVPQPNIYAQPTYGQEFMGQNQMGFGLNSHPHQQFQPPIRAGEQGVQFNPMQLERNRNMRPSTSIPGNGYGGPVQFHPGAYGGRGRTTFQRGGRSGWRSAK
ncbi:H/ACA ribonucleoprotein complex non-core subunit NAF1 [Senna tora]|uniref:H/ACA ribonucleoprotein complex non-core subunit NAF1 n=1 Tax=Senna tora TaxID=362788 RepID=A0A834TL40_9FABA|nr:H/ACA ribonucleoprotein complex non-core subunit NAF1 [Senna tora]